jgi:hypothetical protein
MKHMPKNGYTVCSLVSPQKDSSRIFLRTKNAFLLHPSAHPKRKCLRTLTELSIHYRIQSLRRHIQASLKHMRTPEMHLVVYYINVLAFKANHLMVHLLGVHLREELFYILLNVGLCT